MQSDQTSFTLPVISTASMMPTETSSISDWLVLFPVFFKTGFREADRRARTTFMSFEFLLLHYNCNISVSISLVSIFHYMDIRYILHPYVFSPYHYLKRRRDVICTLLSLLVCTVIPTSSYNLHCFCTCYNRSTCTLNTHPCLLTCTDMLDYLNSCGAGAVENKLYVQHAPRFCPYCNSTSSIS